MKTKNTGIRVTLSREELQEYYVFLSGRIGQLQAEAAIKDLKPSEYRPQVEYLRMTADRIEELLRRPEEPKKQEETE